MIVVEVVIVVVVLVVVLVVVVEQEREFFALARMWTAPSAETSCYDDSRLEAMLLAQLRQGMES